MKSNKFLFASPLLLLIMGGILIGNVAFSAAIPETTNPLNEGPEVWTMSVYNDSTSALTAGDVVVWGINDSTGDNDNWVETTTTADTQTVAGVVYPVSIAAKTSGTIAIKGPVSVNTNGAGLNTVDGSACTSTTAGKAQSCTTATGVNRFGIVTSVASSGVAIVNVKVD